MVRQKKIKNYYFIFIEPLITRKKNYNLKNKERKIVKRQKAEIVLFLNNKYQLNRKMKSSNQVSSSQRTSLIKKDNC